MVRRKEGSSADGESANTFSALFSRLVYTLHALHMPADQGKPQIPGDAHLEVTPSGRSCDPHLVVRFLPREL